MEQDDHKLRELLKKSPALTPPESFYQAVLRNIERKKMKSEEPAPWYFGYPAKALATACILMIIVLVTRETKKTQPELLDQIQSESRPAPASVISKNAGLRSEIQTLPRAEPKALEKPSSFAKEMNENDYKQLKDETKADKPIAPANAPAEQNRKGFVLQARDTVGGTASQSSFMDQQELMNSRRGLVADQEKSQPISMDKSAEGQKEAVVVGALKKTLTVANHISNKILPARKDTSAVLEEASTPSSQGNEEWRGTTSGIDHARQVVVRNPAEWEALWNEHVKSTAPSPSIPTVDFDHNMVVGIFDGSKPSTGYSVGIAAIRLDPERITVIYYEMEPETDRTYVMTVTQPYVLRVIPKNDRPVVFLKAQ